MRGNWSKRSLIESCWLIIFRMIISLITESYRATLNNIILHWHCLLTREWPQQVIIVLFVVLKVLILYCTKFARTPCSIMLSWKIWMFPTTNQQLCCKSGCILNAKIARKTSDRSGMLAKKTATKTCLATLSSNSYRYLMAAVQSGCTSLFRCETRLTLHQVSAGGDGHKSSLRIFNVTFFGPQSAKNLTLSLFLFVPAGLAPSVRQHVLL
jgi:hypothetical protein